MHRNLRRVVLGLLTRPRKLLSAVRLATGHQRHVRRFYHRKDNTAAPPTSVMLRVTDRCNLRCIHCGQWGDHVSPPSRRAELSTAQWRELIEQVASFRPYINIWGGEALLRPDTIELIAASSEKGLLTSLDSNGTLLQKNANDLVRSGLDRLYVSLNGPQDLDQRIRQSDSSFRRTVDGLRAVMEARRAQQQFFPIVQVSTVVTQENQHRLLETAEVVEELGVDCFAFLFEVFTTSELERKTRELYRHTLDVEPKYWRGFLNDVSQIDTAVIEEQLEEIRSRDWQFQLRRYPSDRVKGFSVRDHYLHPERAHNGGLCAVSWLFSQVMPNGDVATCMDHPDYIAGNIKERPFLEIWNGPRYQRFRRVIREQGCFPSCTRCWGLYEIPHHRNETLPPRWFA